MKISCICFTGKGAQTALRIRDALAGEAVNIGIRSGGADSSCPAVIGPAVPDVHTWVREHFQEDDALVFVGAAGIAVRLIAPYLRSKAEDPAVVVVDEAGKWAISLLSGHLGGANDLARAIAAGIGAEPVVTTATDLRRSFAADLFAKENGMEIGNLEMVKEVSSAVLDGRPVGFFADASFPVAGTAPCGLTVFPTDLTPYEDGACEDRPDVGISVSLDGQKPYFRRNLFLIPKAAVLGVGCRKGIEPQEMERFLFNFLDASGVSLKAVSKIASVDVKAEEPAIRLFCRRFGIPYETYTVPQLVRVPGKFSASSFVEKTIGVDNVCERSAVLGAMDRELPGKLIVEKKAYGGMTAALALIPREYRWQTES